MVVIPDGCLLNPSDTAAVVGGNVLTSQRVVDVVFRAFSTCAASQGCMNNTTFGDETVGYYETVAGGAGAVRSYHPLLEQREGVLLASWGWEQGSLRCSCMDTK